MLQFRVLGPLTVNRDGGAVELSGQRHRQALTLLLLERNRVVSSDRLIEALWGEQPPPTAAAGLRNVIAHLRKGLGQDAIETRPPGYVLHVPPGALDLDRFEERLHEARGAAGARRSELLRAALGEWRGAPLPELRYEQFVQTELRRLEELHVAAEEDLLENELEEGASAEVVARLEELTALHPHRERLRGSLMLALYRSGRQADALSIYQDGRRRLSEDLGLAPGPHLRRLHASILRQEPELEEERRSEDRAADLGDIAEALLAGRLVPVLANAPSAAEHLAARFGYPTGGVVETSRVSQYVATLRGSGPLHDELRTLAEASGDPTALHRFLASLPPLLRARGLPHQLIVTTDYDDALERAFAEAGEEADVVTYLGAGPNRGRFCHTAPDDAVEVINDPAEYASELSLERRTIVLRLRGRVDPTPRREWESFIVTEDDHLDYMRSTDVAGGVPISLAATLRRSHFLFLGYAVHDWCLRLVLTRIAPEGPLAYRSWAVMESPGPTDAELWRRVGVQLVARGPERYAAELADAVAARARR